MATVAEVMDDVALECSTTPPTSWITANSGSYSELKLFLRQTVEELLDRVDWANPLCIDYVITGTGDETYAMPSDFKRLTRDPMAVLETTNTRRPVRPVTTNGAWTNLETLGASGSERYYRLSGDEQAGYSLSFFQPPIAGVSITASYITKNWLKIGSTAGAVWSDVAATLLLPRKIVEMGIIWRFRRRKGFDYTDRKSEYEANLMRLANEARQIRTISFGDRPTMRPFEIPVPDYITVA